MRKLFFDTELSVLWAGKVGEFPILYAEPSQAKFIQSKMRDGWQVQFIFGLVDNIASNLGTIPERNLSTSSDRFGRILLT